MDWEPAERVQKNAQGQYRAMIGGEWVPVVKAQKNEQGQYRVDRGQPEQISQPREEPSALTNIAAGALRGAAGIGATILHPFDSEARSKNIQQVESALSSGSAVPGLPAADLESMGYGAGKLASEIAGTAGAGGAIVKGLGLAKYAPNLAAAIESGGFKLAAPAQGLKAAATRAAGGAISGGAMAGMTNPEDAKTGAAIGAAMPVAVKGAGKLGSMLIKKATPEVAALAQKAQSLGIEIPADRLVDSKTLNSLSASLNYVPLSGRATTEARLNSQINKAVSRTIGQNSENVTDALRKASAELGQKFDDVLKSNVVKVDDTFLNDLAEHAQRAASELSDDQARIIHKQIDDVIAKASTTGEIDGQAAYNIKRTLDRIGKTSQPAAYYASDLKRSLMDALDRSIGPEEAAKFAKVRKQYGNMLTLEKLAPAGAEGEISMGRLANLRNVRDKELSDLVDIAAQFGRMREAPHSSQQRAWGAAAAGALGLSTGTLPLMAGGMALGRGANALLDSPAMRNAMLGKPGSQVVSNALANAATRAAILQGNP